MSRSALFIEDSCIRNNMNHGILIEDNVSSLAISFCTLQDNGLGPFKYQSGVSYVDGSVRTQGCLFGDSSVNDSWYDRQYPWFSKIVAKKCNKMNSKLIFSFRDEFGIEKETIDCNFYFDADTTKQTDDE